MLQTWRLNSKDQNNIHQRQAFDPETARPIVQQACNSCRVKKLRCSGEKTGCLRCQTLSQECVYAQNTTRGSGRARKKSTSKIDDGETLRSSASANPPSAPPPPTVKNGIEPVPPLAIFAPVCDVPNPEKHVAPVSDAGTMMSLDTNMMQFEQLEYLPMQNMPTMDLPDLGTYHNSDGWLFSLPDFTPESHLSFDKLSREGVPLSLPSRPGEELGMHSYDETPLTPTTGSLVLEPVITDIQTTPLSLTPHTVPGQHGSDDCHWVHSTIPESCQCLQRVVFLLEEIDSESVDTDVKELGSWLSRHKEALRCSEALLMCPRCQAKPEHMTILAFLTDRLLAMCDKIISAYLLTLAGNINLNLSGPKDGAWLVWVDNFEIDSPHEWSALVSTMIAMQLRGLDTLMAKFKDLLRCVGGEGVRKKADSTQGRILALLEKLEPLQRE